MFTGRSEFRLSLRPDNADLRLTERGHEIGCVGKDRYQKFATFKDKYNAVVDHLKHVKHSTHFLKGNIPLLPFGSDKPVNKSLFDILQFEAIDVHTIRPWMDKEFDHVFEDARLMERVKIQGMYQFVEMKQFEEIDEIRKHEAVKLPYDFDYNVLNISREAREKLSTLRPVSLGQASRIQGMPPAAILKLFNYFKNQKNFVNSV
jgi:tRNA uridine 5-carboxymethylaminomethyl modification enzyme